MAQTFLTAVGFLTILPVRLKHPPRPGDLGKAAIWFPLVGVLMGLSAAAGWMLFRWLFPPLLAAVLTTALWAILTGGLHLDGLADCCDGFFLAGSKERRLEIMRDPRIGTFGVLGLVFHLLLKAAAVSGLNPDGAIVALVLAPAAARAFLLPAGLLAPARPEGLGAQFAGGLSRGILLAAAAGILAGMAFFGWWYLAAGLFAGLSAAAVLLLAWKKIGGATGDVFGMLVEVSELAFLLFLNLSLL